MHALATELFPICRSITGDGVRQTLDIIERHIPLTVHEVPTETQVFDWTVPKEWNLRGAFIKDPRGRTIVNVRDSNLHVVNYSAPVHRRMTLAELRNHLHSLPDQPDLIPYRTSYYRESWGFCVADCVATQLEEGEYEVCIDSTLEPGHLVYAECFLPGELEDEVLISSHICHPSLANDNLSGVCVSVALAQSLAGIRRRHSFRSCMHQAPSERLLGWPGTGMLQHACCTDSC